MKNEQLTYLCRQTGLDMLLIFHAVKPARSIQACLLQAGGFVRYWFSGKKNPNML